jgi:hypothetical protein
MGFAQKVEQWVGLLDRDAALRRPRPRLADGIMRPNGLFTLAPLNAARTAQRAVPTKIVAVIFFVQSLSDGRERSGSNVGSVNMD